MKATRPVIAALVLTALSAVANAQAAPTEDSTAKAHKTWTNPAIIDARIGQRGAFASIAEYYTDYKGRKLEMRDILVGANVTDQFSFWLGRQNFLIKGRSSTSRFDVQDDNFGLKYVVKTPEDPGDPSIALEFESVRPDTATARTKNAFAQFNATKNNRFAVDYGFGNGLQAQLGYANVKGAAIGNADIITLGAGKDLKWGKSLDVRLQGELFEQSYTDAVERINFEIKAMLYAALGYSFNEHARLELDGAFFPGGMPLYADRFTGLSSFQIYRPGGVAEGLRHNAIGFASLRLVLSTKF